MATARDAYGRFVRQGNEDLSSSYRRRVESALSRGKSLKEARGHGVKPALVYETEGLYGKEAYENSLRVLRRMKGGESLTHAAKAEHISTDTVRRHVGSALEMKGSRFVAKGEDHLYRSMVLVTPTGQKYVEPANSKEATKLARYENAVRRYLETGNATDIRAFRRMRLRTRQKQSLHFVTDLQTLNYLAQAGALEFTSIYRLTD